MSCKKHRCACEHESVKYCKKCCVVHCMDCNQEWTAGGWHQPYWYGNSYTTGNITQQSIDITPTDTINAGSATTCDH